MLSRITFIKQGIIHIKGGGGGGQPDFLRNFFPR